MNINFGDQMQVIVDGLELQGTVSSISKTEDRKEIREHYHIDLETMKDEWSVCLTRIVEKKDEVP